MLIAEGKDPLQERKISKKEQIERSANTFESIALEWHEHKRRGALDTKDAKLELSRLKRHVFPYIGGIPIKQVKGSEIIEISRVMESENKLSEARKTRGILNQIFKYAIATGRAEHNLISDTTGAYKQPKENHFPYFSEKEFKEFLKNFESFRGNPLTKLALKLLILTFLRSGAIRFACWNEFDFEKKEWRVPADHMKMKRLHIVPLSKQALLTLEEIKKYHNGCTEGLLFPNYKDPSKPITDSTLSKALRDQGYKGKATPHGMRATASTILNERGFRSDVIEMQLAHREKNKVRDSYNHAQYLQERRELMDWWGDFVQAHS